MVTQACPSSLQPRFKPVKRLVGIQAGESTIAAAGPCESTIRLIGSFDVQHTYCRVLRGRPVVHALTAKLVPRGLSPGVSFVVYVLGSVAAFAAAAAPTPLYDRMQQDWEFPSGLLTAAFSIYAVTLLLALLCAGSLANHVGVRPVLVLGFTGTAISMLVLCFADSIGAVIAARGVQGAATGAVISALGAGIVRFAPSSRSSVGPTIAALAPQLGSALGAIGAAVALTLPTAPAPVVFGSYTFLLFGVAVVCVWLPEAQARAAGAWRSMLPSVAVPLCARAEFVRAAPLVISGWMLGALYLSLVPVIVRATLGGQVAMMGGLATGLFCLVAAGAGAFCGRMRPRTSAVWGALLMASGALALAASVLFSDFPLFAAATLLTASGFGAGNAAAFRLVVSRVPERQRVQVFSALYVVSYLAFGLPVALTGGLADALGLATATIIYAFAIGMLALGGGIAQLRMVPGRRLSKSG